MADLHQGQVAGTKWDPSQYLRFADHRLRPALELLGRVPLESPKLVYDLGCGAGNVTRMIANQWPEARVIGVDNSREMLQKAAAEPSNVEWVEADVRTWVPDEAPDVIYSNATLQWVEGHADLFPRLIQLVKPGGAFAVQVPMSWNADSHRLMRETLATAGPNGGPLGDEPLRRAMSRDWVLPGETYYDLLIPFAKGGLDLWETMYYQVLMGEDPVLEWVKGTGLRPALIALNDEDRERFVSTYAAALREAYPMRSDGVTLYPFRRLFMVAMV